MIEKYISESYFEKYVDYSHYLIYEKAIMNSYGMKKVNHQNILGNIFKTQVKEIGYIGQNKKPMFLTWNKVCLW